MKKTLPVLVVFVMGTLAVAPAAVAQPSFTEVSPAESGLWNTGPDEDFWVNAVAPADYDGDGDLDLAALGFYVVYHVSAVDRLVLFRNDGPDAQGNWLFGETDVTLPADLYAGASDIAWGDYDGDGDPDLVVGSEGRTVLYRNDGGTLALTTTVLPPYFEDSSYTGAYDLRSITWADVDNDDDLDLLVPSVFDFDTYAYSTRLLRNDGPVPDAWLFTDMSAAIDPTPHAQSAWADDDRDDDLDLFLTNIDPYTETGFIKRFRNDGGAFTGEDLLPVKVQYGLADWGDYDADGDMDILVCGNIQESDGTYATVLRTYRNDGGSYTHTTIPDNWLDLHAATWADYDSDGDTDILATGNYVGDGEIVGKSEIYGNAAGVFTDLGVSLPAPVDSVGRGGSFTWFDLDGDGDLDYYVAGAYYVEGGGGLVEAQMNLYRNDAAGQNAAPGTPSSLSASEDGAGGVVLDWAPATDDHTPQAALTYDLEVHGAGSSIAIAERAPEPGSVSAVTNWTLRGLAPGAYTWTVRAIDNAFNGGEKAEGSFAIGGGPVGPPGVPGGRTGTGVTVTKLNPAGSTLSVTWDTTTCAGDVGHQIVYGSGTQLPASPGGSFSLSGSRCGATSPYTWINAPDPSSDPSRMLWLLVLATDGATTEGSWGEDSAGGERSGPAPGGASGECGITAKSLANACGH